jgi:hypothetical protein
MSSQTSRSSCEACDSVPGDFNGAWEEEGSNGGGGGTAIESRIDRLGAVDSFGFGVGTSAVLTDGTGVGPEGRHSMTGAICSGGTGFVSGCRGEGGGPMDEMRPERRGFRSGVARAST